jgi:medium-chain acyl-[acyl-carrier-protein] hydrolase
MTSGARPKGWIVPPEGGGNAETRLFCFSSAGAGAASFRLWPSLLSPGIDVFRIQPPGRETRFREPLIRSMNEYVSQLLPELLPALEGRIAFFGHSMGALVAYCTAQHLRRDHKLELDHLMVSSFRSPQAPTMKRIHELADGDFVRELRETYDGVPDQLLHEPEVLSLMLPIIRADLAVASSYQYAAEAPLSCPVSAFGGLEDRWVHEQDLAEWCVQTSARFDLRMFPGNHYYLASATEALADAIRRSLQAKAGLSTR